MRAGAAQRCGKQVWCVRALPQRRALAAVRARLVARPSKVLAYETRGLIAREVSRPPDGGRGVRGRRSSASRARGGRRCASWFHSPRPHTNDTPEGCWGLGQPNTSYRVCYHQPNSISTTEDARYQVLPFVSAIQCPIEGGELEQKKTILLPSKAHIGSASRSSTDLT